MVRRSHSSRAFRDKRYLPPSLRSAAYPPAESPSARPSSPSPPCSRGSYSERSTPSSSPSSPSSPSSHRVRTSPSPRSRRSGWRRTRGASVCSFVKRFGALGLTRGGASITSSRDRLIRVQPVDQAAAVVRDIERRGGGALAAASDPARRSPRARVFRPRFAAAAASRLRRTRAVGFGAAQRRAEVSAACHVGDPSTTCSANASPHARGCFADGARREKARRLGQVVELLAVHLHAGLGTAPGR